MLINVYQYTRNRLTVPAKRHAYIPANLRSKQENQWGEGGADPMKLHALKFMGFTTESDMQTPRVVVGEGNKNS